MYADSETFTQGALPFGGGTEVLFHNFRCERSFPYKEGIAALGFYGSEGKHELCEHKEGVLPNVQFKRAYDKQHDFKAEAFQVACQGGLQDKGESRDFAGFLKGCSIGHKIDE